MRKYIKQWVNHKRGPSVSLPANVGWDILRAHLSTVPDSWRPSIRRGIERSISKQDITLLHHYVAKLDLFTENYRKGHIPLETVVHDRNLVCLIKKQPLGDTKALSEARLEAGVKKLISAEERCAAANARFESEGFCNDSYVSLILSRARFFCAEILGDVDSVYCDILQNATPGGGATITDRGRSKSCYEKLGVNKVTLTPTAAPLFVDLLKVDHGWRDLLDRRPVSQTYSRKTASCSHIDAQIRRIMGNHVEYIASDEVLFVPKDVRNDRPIALSASGNMILQRGVSSVINSKLLAVGIDLRNQGKNKKLARIGSQYPGSMSPCTIDLASASDTISKEFVKAVLPSDWYGLLSDLRHKSGTFQHGDTKRTFRYEKFSAMGNGFTFQLETLLFYCVVRASLCEGLPSSKDVRCPRHIAVYGDDIIVRENQYEPVTKALQMCGFLVNHEKSFSGGSFKESCGGDYYNGVNVRGVYMKRKLETVRDLFHLLNQFQAKAIHNSTPTTARIAFVRSYRAVITVLPKDVRMYGPMWGSDSWLNTPLNSMRANYFSPYLALDEISYLRSKKIIDPACHIDPLTPVTFDLWSGYPTDNRRNRTSLYASLLLAGSQVISEPTYGSKLSLVRMHKRLTKHKIVQCPVWDYVAEEVDLDWCP